ncbi:uncharacterized protein LOC127845533 [Dreissena polymorpha]|uniref:Peptidase C14 caspase domain-containing protein n=1 Tax=Dreissena polymorpha TaxID=45954 RepID=A0A9D4IIF4_DREPO|nr:uncharacterized protein LOC127845533 [Dreissena polymorpha]XP_052232501.1 uncharacterized protein LOC127845533 [Dreissena polymorpha]KAH3776736.1 hypothetical protein DPMN_178169 [Dreissena polymorpha]
MVSVPRAMHSKDFYDEKYIFRQPPLVVFMAMDSPRGTREHSKAKEMVKDEGSKLVHREVDVDMKLLDKFFRKLNPDTVIKRLVNHTRAEIFEEIDNINANSYDAFYFVVLSYLDKGHHHHHHEHEASDTGFKIQFYDKSIEMSELMDRVKSRPGMALKPKVFIVQADDLELLTPNIIHKAIPSGPGYKESIVKIPTDADQLLLVSTIPQSLVEKGHATSVAHSDGGIVTHPTEQDERARRENSGHTIPKSSLLIQAFAQVLRDSDLDVFSNTPTINGKVLELLKSLQLGNEFDDKIPVPNVYSTLTRFLCLK